MPGTPPTCDPERRILVEPQTDAIVAGCTGEYSVGKRCEVYL